jgi:hypothetical protein
MEEENRHMKKSSQHNETAKNVYAILMVVGPTTDIVQLVDHNQSKSVARFEFGCGQLNLSQGRRRVFEDLDRQMS